MTLLVGLMLLAPFVVLALRTTRWDLLERRHRWIVALPGAEGELGDQGDDDMRRLSIDLAAASAHAGR